MDRIQLRRDTSANWAEVNPILLEGEVGFEIDTKLRKIGDGVNRWNDLEYLRAEGIVQETGNSENVVMSQAAVSRELSKLGQIVVSDITQTPKSTQSSIIEIGRILKAGINYAVDIEYSFVTGYLATIQTNSALDGRVADTVASIYSEKGTLQVEYTPTVDVSHWRINPASNYVYNTNSYVKIKAVHEATLGDVDSSIKDVKKFAEDGLKEVNEHTDKIDERVLSIESMFGKNFQYQGIESYSDIELGVVLKKGAVVKNNGVPLIFAEDASLTARQDLPTGSSMVLNSDKILVRVANIAGDVDFIYEPVNTVDGKVLKEDSISGEHLMDNTISGRNLMSNAVTAEKTNFFSSINLINVNDSDVLLGQYLQSTGGFGDNSAYNTTGFIPVKEGVTYYIGSLDVGADYARMLGFYDKDKSKKPIQYLQNVETSFIVPDGAAYIRMSLTATTWEKSQLTEGEMKNYSPYKTVIKPEYMPDYNGKEQSLFFYLPKDIYVADVRTIELYYDQIILGAWKYNIKATCSVGKALERKFQIIGNSSKLGDYTLKINVYDDSGTLIVGGASTIHIVSSNVDRSITILPIGDSLTNDKPWLSELKALSDRISTVGTRKKIHEGRSGATVSDYTNVSGVSIYNYDNYYKGTGSDAEIFSETKSYAEGEIVRVAKTTGTGQSGYDVYVFTSAHSAGVWNGNDVYCINQGNPFYDFNNKKFSMNFYKSFQGIDYNMIMIYLGTNGISLTPETNKNGALGIKYLIELIRQEDTTSPIVVVNTIFRSGQNGIGSQGNTDGYKAQSAYKFEEDQKVLLLGKALEEMVGSMDNVYLCPVGFTHDSKYNFGNTKVQVNPRLSDVNEVYELQPSDSVHPQECGYLQMADEMFSTICAITNL